MPNEMWNVAPHHVMLFCKTCWDGPNLLLFVWNEDSLLKIFKKEIPTIQKENKKIHTKLLSFWLNKEMRAVWIIISFGFFLKEKAKERKIQLEKWVFSIIIFRRGKNTKILSIERVFSLQIGKKCMYFLKLRGFFALRLKKSTIAEKLFIIYCVDLW